MLVLSYSPVTTCLSKGTYCGDPLPTLRVGTYCGNPLPTLRVGSYCGNPLPTLRVGSRIVLPIHANVNGKEIMLVCIQIYTAGQSKQLHKKPKIT